LAINSPLNDQGPEEDIVELEPCEVDEVLDEDEDEPLDEPPSKVHRWIRVILVVLTVPWLAVFGVATQLNPYKDPPPGQEARNMGTHMQLGLPDCNFKQLTDLPCPSCGMTTSFCLLIRADILNSMRANFAGTALASFGLLFIPWALASAFFGRFMFIRSLEMVVFRLAIAFLVLLFGRWALVLILDLTTRS
jgi:hypothetical protein